MSDSGLLAEHGAVGEATSSSARRPRPLSPEGRGENDHFDVSVCIANWNCRDFLRNCLHSLLRQPNDITLEVIVVDNASSDGAADMVACEFPEARLIRNASNQGFSQANNQAARLARGRHLFFLNNDTVVLPGALHRLVDYADSHPEAGMIGPMCRDAEGRPQLSFRHRPTMAALLHKTIPLRWTGLCKRAYRRYRRQTLNTACEVDILMGAAVLLPRWRFLACGSWDEEFTFGGEDMELAARINRVAKVIYLPQAEIVHFGRVSSRQRIGFAVSQLEIGRVRYFSKTGHGSTSILLYKLLITIDAPLQLIATGIQGLWRCLLHKQTAAERSWLAMRGTWHFLSRGLVEFWRA